MRRFLVRRVAKLMRMCWHRFSRLAGLWRRNCSAGSERTGHILAGHAGRDLAKHLCVSCHVVAARLGKATPDFSEFVDQRNLNHGLSPKSCSGVTIVGDSRRRRALSNRMCSNLFAFAKCLQFQVSKYCSRYHVAKARWCSGRGASRRCGWRFAVLGTPWDPHVTARRSPSAALCR